MSAGARLTRSPHDPQGDTGGDTARNAAPDPDPDSSGPAELASLVLALIGTRHSVAPKRLLAPGPDADQLRQMVDAAACAPDHRTLRPWRLVAIADYQRPALADLFEACTRDRDPDASPDDLARSRDKAFRAPTLLLAVLRSTPDDPEVPLTERAVTLGAALMSLLLAAHGLGFGAMLTSGRAVRTARFEHAFALAEGEQAVCFVSIGSPSKAAPKRLRASAQDLLSAWTPGIPPGT